MYACKHHSFERLFDTVAWYRRHWHLSFSNYAEDENQVLIGQVWELGLCIDIVKLVWEVWPIGIVDQDVLSIVAFLCVYTEMFCTVQTECYACKTLCEHSKNPGQDCQLATPVTLTSLCQSTGSVCKTKRALTQGPRQEALNGVLTPPLALASLWWNTGNDPIF